MPNQKKMNTLTISQLNKTYPNGVTSINNLSLELSNGMFGLLGPNGAGKSSLMRTIATLQTPDSGTIYFNGANIQNDPVWLRSQLGYLPQEFGVYPKLSAYALLDHLAILKGIINKSQRKEQIAALLHQTNLTDHQRRSVHTFSGGMRQRFGIAQALLGDPKIIIVDEPTAGLDPEERNRFNNLLSAIGEQVIVILSTHIVEDVRDLCTRMAIIAKGTLLAEGNPEVFIEKLKGQIWSKTITRQQFELYNNRLKVISSRLHAGKLNIHVFSPENPGDGFHEVHPDLEDVYFRELFA